MIKIKCGFFGRPAFSSLSGLFEIFQIALIGWMKAGPLKTPFGTRYAITEFTCPKDVLFGGPAFYQPTKSY